MNYEDTLKKNGNDAIQYMNEKYQREFTPLSYDLSDYLSETDQIECYATITRGQYIDHCYSFDGQGFSDSFVSKYNYQIAENQGKIKSICGDDDPVNGLLNQIVLPWGKRYIDVPDVTKGFEPAHSSFQLWKSGEEFHVADSRGDYTNRLVEQALMATICYAIINRMKETISIQPESVQRVFYINIGHILGIIMDGSKNVLQKYIELRKLLLGCLPLAVVGALLRAAMYELRHMDKSNNSAGNQGNHSGSSLSAEGGNSAGTRAAIFAGGSGGFTVSIKNSTANSGGSTARSFEVRAKGIKSACSAMKQTGNNLKTAENMILEVASQLAIDDSVNTIMKKKLTKLSKNISNERAKDKRMRSAAEQISNCYDETERIICALKH